MKVGDRIKLLRVFQGYTQAYLADIAGLRQRNIAMIEKSSYHPSDHVLTVLSSFFFCSFQWLTYGHPPAFDHLWGYAHIPGQNAKSIRKLNEIDFISKTFFVEFLQENHVRKYYLVRQKNSGGKEDTRLYVFPLMLPTVLALKVVVPCWAGVNHAISQANLNLAKEISITSDEIDCIDDPQSSKTLPSVVAKVWESLGIGKKENLLRRWLPILKAPIAPKDRLKQMLYEKQVNEICRLIVEKNLDIFDVIDNMKKYDRSYMTGSIFDDLEKLARIAKESRKEK